MRKRSVIWLTVFVCLALLLAVYAVKGLYPFGEKTILVKDLYQQGIPLLYNFRDTVTGQNNLFFHLEIYGGLNNYVVALSDLVNPVNYLLLLFPRTMIPQAANVLLLCYLALSALTSARFFCRQYPKNGIWNVVFAMGYALSSYFLYMYQIFAWLPVAVLFPLVMLSLFRLLETGKGGRFSLLLAWTIVLSFQLGAMTVLFLLFGGGIYLFRYLEKPKRAQAAWRIGAHTILGIAISGAFLLPYLLELTQSMRSEAAVSFSIWNQLGLSELFDRMFILFHPLTFAAVFLWIWERRKKSALAPEEKTIWPALCTLLALTIFINPWHDAWHLGTHMRFPARFGYMAALCALCALERRALRVSEGENRCPRFALGMFCACMLLSMGVTFLKHEDFARGFETLMITHKAFWDALCIAGIFILLFLAGVIVLTRKKARLRAGLAFVLAVGFGLATPLMCLYSERNLEHYSQMHAVAEMDLGDGDFRRVAGMDLGYEKNAGLVASANTIGGYLPMGAPRAFRKGLRKLGYDMAWVSTSCEGGTLFSDALLCIGYRIAPEEDAVGEALCVEKTPMGESTVYEMEYLPLGVLMDTEELDAEKTGLDFQNSLYRALGGEGELFSRAEGILEDGQIRYSHDSGPCVGYLTANRSLEKLDLRVNGDLVSDFRQPSGAGEMVCLGILEPGDVVETSCADALESAEIWQMDLERYRQLLETWADTPGFQIEGNRISGTVQAEEGQTLLLQIAGNRGLRATVDGEPVEIEPILEGLVGVPLEAGEHEIQITFLPAGWRAGIAISLLGLLGLFLAGMLRRRGVPAWMENAALIGYGAALGIGAVWAYGVSLLRLILELI